MENYSQKKMIFDWLQSGYRITQLNAASWFGCFRLAARIDELKREGWNIASELIPVNGKHVAE
jgi:hypothetical protein